MREKPLGEVILEVHCGDFDHCDCDKKSESCGLIGDLADVMKKHFDKGTDHRICCIDFHDIHTIPKYWEIWVENEKSEGTR